MKRETKTDEEAMSEMRAMDNAFRADIEAWNATRVADLALFPPFSGPTKWCPKCEWPGVGIDYVSEVPPRYPSTSWSFSWPEREHIRRTCTRCGFVWKERPVDAEGAP